MITSEQAKFAELITESLAQYTKAPTAAEIEAWWLTCKRFSMSDVERALKDHAAHADDGKRAPRPIDVKRRLDFGTRESSGCAAAGAAGRCAYPGLFSETTTGSETWWCPWHRIERSGPDAERWIEVSQTVPYETAMAKRAQRMLEEGQRAAGVVHTSHAIAIRHGNRPWHRSDAAAPFSAPVNQDAEAAA